MIIWLIKYHELRATSNLGSSYILIKLFRDYLIETYAHEQAHMYLKRIQYLTSLVKPEINVLQYYFKNWQTI